MWLRRESNRNDRLHRACMPITEALEGRTLFANFIWDGGAGAADPNWSNPDNWQGNSAPSAGDTLFFPATGVSQRTSFNDLDPGTEFAGINIDGSNSYTISGNAIALGSGGINVNGNASHAFDMPIFFANTGRSVSVNDLASLRMSGPFTGNGALNKNANGLLDLTGNSPEFAGVVNVNAGTLRINSQQALGNTTGGTFVVSFATLVVGTGASGISEFLSLAGEGDDNLGALRAEGTAAWAGEVEIIGGNTTINVETGDFTFSNDFERGATGNGIIKVGSGRLIFSDSAAENANLTINAGIVRLSGPNPDFGNVIVNSGTTLEISGGRTATFDSLSLNGNGSGTGALLNVANNNTINGPITLAGSATIGSTAGTLTLRGDLNTGNANPARTLTIAGAGNVTIGGTGTGAITGSGVLTKTGNGTLTLSGTGNSTYTGATNVSQGVLIARKASALGGTGTGTTVSSGASLRLEGGVTLNAEPLTINGAGVGNAGALGNVSGNNTYTGNITLGSPARIGSAAGTLLVSGNIDTTANAHALTVTGAGTTEFGGAGVLSGAGRLIKEGTGTLILSGTGVNTYSGVTEVHNGSIQLRKSSALGATTANTVTFGQGTVQVFSDNSPFLLTGVTIAEPIRINGSGFNGLGALQNGSGRLNVWSGTVAVNDPASIGSALGLLNISGVISGNQTLTKVGTAGIALSGNNSGFTGRLLIESGSLNARSNNALGSTGGNSDTRVGNNAALVLGFSGFNGVGGVNIANEALSLFGAATLRAASTLGGGASTWGGPIGMSGSTSQRFFEAQSQLTITGQIGGTAPLVKTGARDLILAANNPQTGGMTVNAGRLLVNGTLPGAVVVASGAEVGGTGTIGSLEVKSGGVVNPGVNGPGILTISNGLTLRAGSITRVEINGTAAGTQHDQIRVLGGTVNFATAQQRNGNLIRPRLEGTLGFNSATGDQFRIIDNAGTGATTGRFSTVTETIGDEQFSVATNGGTGNDVVLTTL